MAQNKSKFNGRIRLLVIIGCSLLVLLVCAIASLFILEIEDVIYADGQVTSEFTIDMVSHLDGRITKLYVNAAFTENNLAAGQILGINAFTGMTAALKAVAPATESIEVTGDVTEDIPAEALTVTLSKDLIIAGSGETASVVTLNNGGYKTLIFGAADGAEDIDVKFENIQLLAPKTPVIFEFDISANVFLTESLQP